MDEATRIRIRLHIEKFLSSKIQSLEVLSLSEMSINPLLIAAMGSQIGITNARELARWMVLQRVERGSSTGFGTTLKHIAREFCNADPLPGMDARIERGESTYNLLITSGPKHNLGAARAMRKRLLETKNAEPDSVPVLGMCYGSGENIGGITKKYGEGVLQIAGRDFWAFVSADPDCYQNILEIAASSHKHVLAGTQVTLECLIQRKIDYVADELESLRRNEDDSLITLLGGAY